MKDETKQLSPIERVAQTLFYLDGNIAWINGGPDREMYMERARTVLTALVEPSEAMCDAGIEIREELYPRNQDEARNTAQGIWRCMVDAALTEGN